MKEETIIPKHFYLKIVGNQTYLISYENIEKYYLDIMSGTENYNIYLYDILEQTKNGFFPANVPDYWFPCNLPRIEKSLKDFINYLFENNIISKNKIIDILNNNFIEIILNDDQHTKLLIYLENVKMYLKLME